MGILEKKENRHADGETIPSHTPISHPFPFGESAATMSTCGSVSSGGGSSSSASSSSFSHDKRKQWAAYHLVSSKDIARGSAKKADRQLEFTLRVNYTKTYYKNRYDRGHKHWMRKLASTFTISDMLDMPLDASVTCQKLHVHVSGF